METKARRLYNQVLGELLTRDEEGELAQKLELLKLFLDSADFNRLRSESEKHLVEGRKVKFILHLDEGQPKYEMKII